MIVSTQLLVVVYTFFCDYLTFVLYFIHFYFFCFWQWVVCPCPCAQAIGQACMAQDPSLHLLYLFYLNILFYLVSVKKKKGGWLIKRVLETRFPSGRHIKRDQTMETEYLRLDLQVLNRVFQTRDASEKYSLKTVLTNYIV